MINQKDYYEKSELTKRETALVSQAIDNIMKKYALSWENKVVLAYYVNEYNKKSKLYEIVYEDTPLNFFIGLRDKHN